VTVPRGVQQPLEHRALAFPSDQPPRLRPDGHSSSMPARGLVADVIAIVRTERLLEA
jgi:hypothetical protein